jgi:hypothetical protein
MLRWIDVQNWESQNDKWRAKFAQLYIGKRRQTAQNAENMAVLRMARISLYKSITNKKEK